MQKTPRSLRAVGVTQEPGGCAGIFKETSLALAARTYTDDEKVSLAVTRLAENEKLLEALAWRLGIPLADVRRDGREPRLARDCMRNGVVPKRGGGRDEGCHDSDGVEKAYDEEELEENREQKEVSVSIHVLWVAFPHASVHVGAWLVNRLLFFRRKSQKRNVCGRADEIVPPHRKPQRFSLAPFERHICRRVMELPPTTAFMVP